MKLLIRSILLILALYGLVFAVGDLYLARHGAPMWVAALFALAIVGVQYWIGPWLIQLFLRIQWDDAGTELPVRNREFLQKLCAERGLGMPRVGIIHGAMPNAFTFGHVPGDARLVVTTGLLRILTPEETNAVLAHEMGHVEHYDFIVMTLAALAPLLLYQLYAFTRNTEKARAIAAGAYLCYWVSEYIVLMLSRTREYFADTYSADVTGTPDALATALVKIGYGLFQADCAVDEAREHGSDQEKARLFGERRRSGAMALMGICNVSGGGALALGPTVMRWDLVNPWARLYELNSTHPLTAFRIRALNRKSEAMGHAVSHPLPEDRQMRWAAFPLELAVWAAPWLFALAVLAVSGPRGRIAGYPHELAPMLLALTGAAWMLRTWMRYHGAFQPATIATLMEDRDVSQMRPRAVKLEGSIVGFGVPGSFWCADLVFRDSTGILFVLYKQAIPLARLMFAVTTASGYIGQKVVLEGWFRRGMKPYIEMACLTGEDGKPHITWSRWVHHGLAALVTVGGLLWLAVGK